MFSWLAETVMVARWIPVLAVIYILFLQGLLVYIVYKINQQSLRPVFTIKPDTSDSPPDNKDNHKPIKQGTRNERA